MLNAQFKPCRTSLWQLTSVLVVIVMTTALAACGGHGSSAGSQAASAPPAPAATGAIVLSGRTEPTATALTPAAAKPDQVTPTIEEAAISTDGSSYQTIVTGPVQPNFTATSNFPIGGTNGLQVGTYNALRLAVSAVDWQATWGFLNPSPCDGSTTGSASGTVDLSATPVIYFKTPGLGGNTMHHYLATPPATGYIGDANHPLVLPAPIEILDGETTTVNLVIEANRTLSCNRLSVFARTADSTSDPTTQPLGMIEGSMTALYGVGMLAVDPLRNQVAVTNGLSNSITFYDGGAGAPGNVNVPPVRLIAGPATVLNKPSGIALYSDPSPGGSGDQYIAANSNNNSIVTYSATVSNNTAPLRTITGYQTGLSQPSGVAIYPDPSSDPTKDEIFVANRGNDSITGYTRLDYGNSLPLTTITGAATGLASPCGIAIDAKNQKIFAANSTNNSITVYSVGDTGNIAPFSTLAGSSTLLSAPCGIYVDNINNEVIVANTGNDSVSVFSSTAFSSGTDNVPPLRTITGPASGIHQPIGVQVAGNELWVADNGGQAEMAFPPTIIPVATNASSVNAGLNGDYNVVLYGADLRQGVNGLGFQIPIMFSARGTASFNAQTTPWPSFSLKLDSENMRQLMEASCGVPDLQAKNGFYGMAAHNRFYAVSQDREGVIIGSFLPDGQAFTGTFSNGNQIFVLHGTKSTDVNTLYLSSDGTSSGGATPYAYASYHNDISNITRPITDAPNQQDILNNQLDVGAIYSDSNAILSLYTDTDFVFVRNPMGDAAAPVAPIPQYRVQFITSTRPYPYVTHAGGLFEVPNYGMAGTISKDTGLLTFMSNLTQLDANNCPLSFGVGLGLREAPAHTYAIKDIKGTYFISGFGDQTQSSSTPSRPQYISTSGTIAFDGAGNATMTLTDNREGELATDNAAFTYKITTRNLPSPANTGPGKAITTDVVDLYSAASATRPYASAIIGENGNILVIYLNLADVTDTTNYPGGNNRRLLGFAIMQSP
jgi:Lactonase, 7-bladed beta-propeller